MIRRRRPAGLVVLATCAPLLVAPASLWHHHRDESADSAALANPAPCDHACGGERDAPAPDPHSPADESTCAICALAAFSKALPDLAVDLPSAPVVGRHPLDPVTRFLSLAPHFALARGPPV